MRTATCIVCVMVYLLIALVWSAGSAQAALTPKEELGKLLFFDTNLSSPAGQSCASCHSPAAGFADPRRMLPVSRGAVEKRVGNRNAPTAAYCGYTPAFHYDVSVGGYVGGLFWDGRAATLFDQAKGPFLNALEMNNPNKQNLVQGVQKSSYAGLFRQVYGEQAFTDAETTYDMMADAIAAFERTNELNQFSSKFDLYLQGLDQLNGWEAFGLYLFEGKAGCSGCHPSGVREDGSPPLFTDFTYDNVGVPRNPVNPFYELPPSLNRDGAAWVDGGLGGVLGLPEEMGKMKVPTLRNVAVTAPYTHNGYFGTLRPVVEFYNTRDVGNWPPPEVPANMNVSELGNLGLTPDEIDAIVAFLKALTDGYVPALPKILKKPSETSAARSDLAMTISPNPFNPTTRIEYAVDGGSTVHVGVYDVAGRLVRSLVDEAKPAGLHSATWDGRDTRGAPVASGVYFIRLDTGKQTMIRKAVLTR